MNPFKANENEVTKFSWNGFFKCMNIELLQIHSFILSHI